MNIKLGCTDHDLFTLRDELYVAWQKVRKEQETISNSDLARKNFEHACELFGAYYAICRLLSGVTDGEWQEFLMGGK